ncbi:MAG: hypothetical protein WAV07_11665 [Candidatus Contendobacter sp.]
MNPRPLSRKVSLFPAKIPKCLLGRMLAMSGVNHKSRANAKVMLAVVLTVIVLAFAVVAVWLRIATWLAVDRCLDAGGRYDYANSACSFAEPAPRQ